MSRIWVKAGKEKIKQGNEIVDGPGQLKFRIQGQLCSNTQFALVRIDHNVAKRLKNGTLIKVTKVAKKIKEQ